MSLIEMAIIRKHWEIVADLLHSGALVRNASVMAWAIKNDSTECIVRHFFTNASTLQYWEKKALVAAAEGGDFAQCIIYWTKEYVLIQKINYGNMPSGGSYPIETATRFLCFTLFFHTMRHLHHLTCRPP